MTLIVGIVCKDGIALAADSQTTYFPSKILGTNKINEIKFLNGKALVAEAGFCSLSNAVVDAIQKEAGLTEIKNEETVAEICKQAVRKERQNQMSLYPRRKYSLLEWQSFFRDQQNFFLTIAYYFNREPYLFSIDLSQCVLQKPTFGFIVSGVGEAIGNYILKEESVYFGGFEKVDLELGMAIAIKVADAAAEYVDGCGKPIKAACIQPSIAVPNPLDSLSSLSNPLNLPAEPSRYAMFRTPIYSDPITIFPQTKVDEIAEIVLSAQRKAKNAQNKKIHEALSRQTQKAFKVWGGFKKIKLPVRQSPNVPAQDLSVSTRKIKLPTRRVVSS